MQELTEFLNAIAVVAWPLLAAVVLIILIPSIRRILESRSFSVKYGDAELSVQDASDQLRKQVEDLQNQVARLIGDDDSVDGHEAASNAVERIILWVDDKPSNNAFEIARFQDDGCKVKQVRSTNEALQSVNEGLNADVIITDMGRREANSYIKDAGLRLIKALRESGVEVPIYMYTSPKYAQLHHDQSLEVGGNGATASPVALYKMISNQFR